jgi:hypothetical protein
MLQPRVVHAVRRLRPALVAVLTLGVMTTAVPAPAEEPAIAPSDLLPETGALFGAYVNPQGPDDPDQLRAQLEIREEQLGRKLDIHTLFFAFEELLVDEMVTADVEAGRVPLISWAGTDTRNVRLGLHDPWIRQQAQALREVGGPILVRWAWEMEATRNREWARGPWEFIKAWRRIVYLFRDEGATNVEFAWVPMAVSFKNGEARRWYPGDPFVDWIGVDGYNWAPGREGNPWRSFEQIFTNFYTWSVPRNKPLIIGETGVMERAEGEKAAWFDDVDDTMITTFPEIDALCYFDTRSAYDWRIDTSESSMAAFTEISLNPYLNTRSA